MVVEKWAVLFCPLFHNLPERKEKKISPIQKTSTVNSKTSCLKSLTHSDSPELTLFPTATPLSSQTPTSIYHTLPVISAANAPELAEISRLTKGTIQQAAWMPDGKRILVATAGGVYIYEVSSGLQVQFFQTTADNPSISVDSSGQYLATSENNYVRIWNVETGQELLHLRNDTLKITRVLFSPTEPLLAVEKIVQSSGEGESYEIRETQLWDATTGQLLYTLTGRENPAFSPDGHMLGVFYDISATEQKVEFWNVSDDELLYSIEGDGLFAFDPDGKSVAVETVDPTSDKPLVMILDTDRWNALNTYNGEINRLGSVIFDTLGCDVFSPDGNLLALYDKSLDAVQFWDLPSDKFLYKMSGEICVNFSNVGHTFAAKGMLWDASTGRQIRPLDIGDIGIFSPDGHFLLRRGAGTGIYVVDASTGNAVLSFQGLGNWMHAVAFSPDGKLLATGGGSGEVDLWSLDTGQRIQGFQGFSSISDVTFSPDGQTIAAAGIVDQRNAEEAKVEWWDLGSGRTLYQWATSLGKKTWMTSVAFSEDGKTIAASSVWDYAIRLWDVNTLQIRSVFIPSGGYDQSKVVFTPDGKSIAFSTTDNIIQFWDISDFQRIDDIYVPKDEQGGAFQVAFSQDGRTLVAVGYKTAWVWDMKNKIEPTTIENAGENISSMAISPDGKLLALAGWNSTDQAYEIRLWTLDTLQMVSHLPKFADWIPEITFSPDGRLIATASTDGTIRLWGIRP